MKYIKLILLLTLMVLVFKINKTFHNDEVVHDTLGRAINAVGIIVLCIILNKKLNVIHFIGFHRPVKKINWWVILPFFIPFLYIITIHNLQGIGAIPGSYLLSTMIGAFFAAAAEEFVFRQLGANFLLNRGVSLKATALITSLLFALAHITNIANSDWLSITNQTLMASLLGLLMYCLVVESNNLLTSIIFHFLINIPININRLLPSVEEADEPITLMRAFISIVAIQVLYAPVTITAVLMYKRIRQGEAKMPLVTGVVELDESKR